ncbi:MAG TPA: hypothetical protein VFF78_08185, partial [Anaerolineaceae bacterium]|nr:hypothetical protein [Anaerolineaceae bacterium]
MEGLEQHPLAQHQEELTHLAALGQFAIALVAGTVLTIKTEIAVNVHFCISFLYLVLMLLSQIQACV